MTLKDWEWAWLAGIFEGEGCITFTNTTRKYAGTSVQIKVLMTDKDVIETLDRLVPSPKGIRCQSYEHKKDQWIWKLSSKEVIEPFLQGVLPYLHSRRRQRALDALERLSRCLGAHAKRTHCKHGHEFTAENTYVKSNGARACKPCMRRRDRERIRVYPSSLKP